MHISLVLGSVFLSGGLRTRQALEAALEAAASGEFSLSAPMYNLAALESCQ